MFNSIVNLGISLFYSGLNDLNLHFIKKSKYF